ncbi:helix-turn-helix domain-containing protein [Propionimicrobium sp. PCR01-08-3]|uniref:AraC family transcriptional regulator n=1 Tax=Propionimicrobium sp. PCR01-08-3 TaxID=3052086 RepID=UPI00255C7DE0|nr:helix-turn-helix domain-containing protein [Propionimicrobium sp. PCR01-08-3]WIY82233.1 helix-turn-helix domain-containing protein [Propionimicrobium sp. PCR01-08-3]
MTELTDGRGILYPTKLPSFHRERAEEGIDAWIRWFWVPRWELPPGRTSRQRVLPFPASNLVVQSDGVKLHGPTTGTSHQDLRGRGWAVGASLRPAGIASLHADPHGIKNSEIAFDAPELHTTVTAAMGKGKDTNGLEHAIVAFTEWAAERFQAADANAMLANEMENLISSDRTIVRVDQVATHLGISIRAVQRLARRYVGLPPLAIIRRYRLQEAALRLRQDPSLNIAHVSAELGYADHAHLAADFRKVLGLAPSAYRSDSRDI